MMNIFNKIFFNSIHGELLCKKLSDILWLTEKINNSIVI